MAEVLFQSLLGFKINWNNCSSQKEGGGLCFNPY